MNHKAVLVTSAISLSTLAGLAGFGIRGGAIETNTETRAETSHRVESAVGMTTFVADAVHSNAIFKIRHAGVTNFYGRFNQIDGTIEFDGDDITNSTMNFTIPVSSVDTNSRTRDGHIKGAEFFNARQFKDITFESTSIESNGSDSYTLTGNLTLHGITKEITASLNEVRTGSFRDRDVLGFEARFSIQRSDFEIMKYLADDLSESGPLGNTVELIVAIESGVE